MKPLIVLQISDLARLLHATRFTLDRVVRRCRIPLSVHSPKWGRVIFALPDVAPVALSYWSFRSGLRTQAVKDVLANHEITELLRRLDGPDEMDLEAKRVSFVVTWRVSKRSSAKQHNKDFGQEIALIGDFEGMKAVFTKVEGFGFLVVPVGRLLPELAERLREYIRKIEAQG